MKLSSNRYVKTLVLYMAPLKYQVLGMGLLLLVSIFFQLLTPQILRFFIDTLVGGGSEATLAFASILFIGAALIKFFVSVGAAYMSENIAWKSTNQIRIDLVKHCLTLDLAFYKAHTSGEMVERIDGDVETLANFFSQFVINLLGNALLLVGILVLTLAVDWRIALGITLFSLLAIFVMTSLGKRAMKLWIPARQSNAEFFGFLSEYLGGMEDIRANGATDYVMQRFFTLIRTWLPIYRKPISMTSVMGASTVAIFALSNVFALAMGAYLWSQGQITIGTIYLVFSYTNLLTEPLEQLRRQFSNFQQAGASLLRIDELLSITPTIVDGCKNMLPSGPLSVDFNDVSFAYTTGENIVNHLTFHLSPGQVLGILGRTGSGKTTIARLLLRLYEPQEGEILLGGVSHASAPLNNLRQRVKMVTQDVQLFQGTVRDNLTFFDSSIPDQQIIQVLEEVGLSPWYGSLPDGLDSILGADGEGLSAGQAQLLAFARAFLANPGLIILDEASSRLDPATELLIEQATEKLLVNRTAIIIAHRLRTLELADTVMMIDSEKVLEYGNKGNLENDPTSHFARILQSEKEVLL